jgi:hypothetical protein
MPIEELALCYLHPFELFAMVSIDACQRPALRESACEHGLSAIRE